jgi:PAS domain S-box-containing protein
MKFYFQRKALLGFFLAMSIISWLGFSTYLNNQKYKQSNYWVIHTNEVMFHAERILSLIIDIESGQRGFIITGDSAFLEPYHSGVAVIHKDIDELKTLVSDNENQLARIKDLSKLIEEKLAFAKSSIASREASTQQAYESVRTMQGKILMDQIRKVMHDFQQEEKRLLTARSTINETGLVNFSSTFIALLVATVVILVLVFFAINKNLRTRTEAERALRQAMERVRDMYDNAPCGYHSLDNRGYFQEINHTELRWLGYTKEEVIGKMRFPDILKPEYAIQFEESFASTKKTGSISGVECEIVRKDGTSFPAILSATLLYDKDGEVVKTRSTVFDYTEKKQAEEKIVQLNHELESFTYSVSHDLRAPLRSIDGYARILADDYLKQLDPEGQRVLNVIIKNANRMGKLIDDLLDFSRFGRKEVNKTRYSMEAVIRSVCEEQLEADKNRIVEFDVQSITNALSDPQLIKQVWTNLISNALKYSRKKEKSIVEITSQISEREVIYSICDNGTGFDMQYAHKLFNVFQRLHKAQDFEGTGVGLAIVHRIISRHGGRVWAESKNIDEGACFYFSLPVDQSA